MAFVVVNVASEYLSDGSFHVYSPDVPGFHVIERDSKKSNEQVFWGPALRLLEETLSRRVVEANVGKTVYLEKHTKETPLVEIHNFVPEELRRRLGGDRSRGLPSQLIAEIVS